MGEQRNRLVERVGRLVAHNCLPPDPLQARRMAHHLPPRQSPDERSHQEAEFPSRVSCMQTMRPSSGSRLEPYPGTGLAPEPRRLLSCSAPIVRTVESKHMAKKGYWIAHVQITNPDRYKDYIAANAAPLKRYGARFLVRNGECRVEGQLAGRRHVVIEFDSYATAKACHDSSEYQAAAKIRDEASTADFIIIEGYEE